MIQKPRMLAAVIRNVDGNFGIMTAILAPVLLGVAGMAIDVTRAMQIKGEMQGYADSAVLASATQLAQKGMSRDAAKALAENFYAVPIATHDFSCDKTSSAAQRKAETKVSVQEQAYGNNGKLFEVDLVATHRLCVNPLTSLITGPSIDLAVKASTTSNTEPNIPFSMHLVLDQSSSMSEPICKNRVDYKCLHNGDVRRIDALKLAVEEFTDVIKKADPNEKYARLAAVAYSSELNKEIRSFEWGVKGTLSYVKALRPGGRTNSAPAMDLAYRAVTSEAEAKAHLEAKHPSFRKYIVWMSDGNNNDSGMDATTLQICNEARKNKVVVYSIAFDVDGKRAEDTLKACAKNIDQYYDVRSASQLHDAFRDIALKANAGTARVTR